MIFSSARSRWAKTHRDFLFAFCEECPQAFVMYITAIGPNIRHFLKITDMTQKELASRCCITEAAISQYISGDRVPCLSSYIAICRAFGIKLEDLLK